MLVQRGHDLANCTEPDEETLQASSEVETPQGQNSCLRCGVVGALSS